VAASVNTVTNLRFPQSRVIAWLDKQPLASQNYSATWSKNCNSFLVTFLTKHEAMKAYWGSGGIASRILDLDTRWR
jgi:hypothetical protein